MMQATIHNVTEGTTIVVDSGFTCIDEDTVLTVERDDAGLFVRCAEGKHHLDGQLDSGEVYVGFFIVAGSEAGQRAANG